MTYLLSQWKTTHKKQISAIKKTDFPYYTTFTYLNEAYQDFIIKLNKVNDLFCPSKS